MYTRDIKNIQKIDKNRMLLVYKIWQNWRMRKKTSEMARSLVFY
jgi:hypothetical protein